MKENKTVRLSIRVTEELKARIQMEARKENRSMSNYLENVIVEAIERGGSKMLLVKNLVDGTIYASGEDEDELINSWNKNIKNNLEWLLDESTFGDQEAYDELTEEAYRMENIEEAIRKLNDLSENNDIKVIEG